MKKRIKLSSVFKDEVLQKAPLFYRFMNKLSKEELAKLEYGLMPQSSSRAHRSNSYFMYEPCKPYTRFVPTKVMQ